MALSFGAAVAQTHTNVHGSAVVTTSGSTTTVTTTNGPRGHSALDWSSFGVQAGKTVDFLQPTAQSLSINRVTGGAASAIDGTLKSNGRLVLVNPAGIAFGAGSQVDTASFTASTLGMTTQDMIAGRLRFDLANNDEKDRDKAGTLKVESQSVLARNGDVVLIGPKIEIGRAAAIQAVAGDVILAAGRRVEVTGRGLEGILMEVRAPDDKAVNLGTLKGDSVAIFAGQLQHSGIIEAKTATLSGGRVILQGLKEAEVEGRIEAATGARGGSVLLTAQKLELKKAAFIDVSHANGGGEILVGGGSRGGDARLQNAEEVKVEEGVLLKADATLAGNGGTVVVWSERRTEFRGMIAARYEGDGRQDGQAEVSSGREVKFKGTVDTGAGGASPPQAEGGKGKGKGSKRPGDPGFVLSNLPLEGQPEAVKAVILQPSGESVQAMASLQALAPMSSKPVDAYERKVVVTAVQCTVTR